MTVTIPKHADRVEALVAKLHDHLWCSTTLPLTSLGVAALVYRNVRFSPIVDGRACIAGCKIENLLDSHERPLSTYCVEKLLGSAG